MTRKGSPLMVVISREPETPLPGRKVYCGAARAAVSAPLSPKALARIKRLENGSAIAFHRLKDTLLD